MHDHFQRGGIKLKLIIAGDRRWDSESFFKLIKEEVLNWHTPITEIVDGGAKGIDRVGRHVSFDLGIRLKTIEAEWGKYGGRAGSLRNRKMAEYVSPYKGELLLIWNGESKGSGSMRNEALLEGIKITERLFQARE